jgi:hypothetical protein
MHEAYHDFRSISERFTDNRTGPPPERLQRDEVAVRSPGPALSVHRANPSPADRHAPAHARAIAQVITGSWPSRYRVR